MPTVASALGAEQTAVAWDEVVSTYEEGFEPFTNRFASDALALAAVDGRCRLLDIATGTGGAALAALDRGAEVTAIDFSPGMIARLRQRLSGEQRWRAQALVMDGQELELPAATFDVACSIFGVIFFPEPSRGLDEMVRVLKPGGRAVIAAWSSPRYHEAFQMVGDALAEVSSGYQPPAAMPPWLCYQDPAVFRSALARAGLGQVQIRTVTHAWSVPSAEWFVSHVHRLSPGTRALFEHLDPETFAAFAHVLHGRLEKAFGEGPVCFRAEAHLGLGCKPRHPLVTTAR